MKPILFTDTETGFDSNGIGILSDAISAQVVQELNGQYELTLKYPLTGIHAEHIADRCIIVAKPDPISDPQPFRIYRINPISNSSITVYARHIAYDSMGIPVAPFFAESAAEALAAMKNSAVSDCPFSFHTDKSTAAAINAVVPKSMWKTLGGSEGSILDTYGGEYEFDWYNIYLHDHRGNDRGVSIRYGKNLTTLEQDRNCANVYTGIYPYWSDLEGNVVQLPEKVLHAKGTYNFVRVDTVDLSAEFLEAPSEEQLRNRATKYMEDNNIGVPDVSWTVEFVQLEQTEEYKNIAILERVLLGDTISVVFPQMNVNALARAVKIDFDPILERYNSVTIGKVKSNLAATIVSNQRELQKELGHRTSSDTLKRVSEIATKAILGARGGSVRLLDMDEDGSPDTLYIADNSDPDKAVKVWRWNYEGWGASRNGYNGPFQMAATLEAGILADFITAAHLTSGTLESRDGTFFLDLDNGILRSDAIQIAWNNIDYRVKFEDGEIRIYDETNMVAAYTMFGAKYYKKGLHVGTIGTNQSLAGNTSLNGLSFNLEPSGNFMAWVKDNAPALTWYRSDSEINAETHNAGFHAYDNFYFHNTLKFHGGGFIYNAPGDGMRGNIYVYNDTFQNRNTDSGYLRWNSWDTKTHFFHPIDPSGGILGYSDARLKENIADTDISGLETVCAMEIKQFDRMDNGRHFDAGLIAQQLQEIAPELVGTDEDGLLYIHDEKLIYYAFKAIQELTQAVQELMGIRTFSEGKRTWQDTFTSEEKKVAVAQYTRAKKDPILRTD